MSEGSEEGSCADEGRKGIPDSAACECCVREAEWDKDDQGARGRVGELRTGPDRRGAAGLS